MTSFISLSVHIADVKVMHIAVKYSHSHAHVHIYYQLQDHLFTDFYTCLSSMVLGLSTLILFLFVRLLAINLITTPKGFEQYSNHLTLLFTLL